MTGLLLAAILTPIGASIATLIVGWRRATAALIVLSAITVLGCGAALGLRVGAGTQFALGGLLRVDALSVTMLIVIGIVATLATWASIGYLDAELAHGHTDARGARVYGLPRSLLRWLLLCAPTTSASSGSPSKPPR